MICRHRLSIGVVVGLLLVRGAWPGWAAQPEKSPMVIGVNADKGELEMRYLDRKLLVYAFAASQFKPYVRELYPLRGGNVLRDAPPDHLHHHGLMYAIRVNGINFWEERDAPGFQKSVKLISHTTGRSSAGLPQARMTQLIHWLAPTNRNAADSTAAAWLVETRTLTLTVEEKVGEVALQWDAEFAVGKGGEKVTLHGAEYNGLGLRLPESFNHVAVFQNSANAPYVSANTQNVTPAAWTSVTGKLDGQEIMVAMTGSSANAGGGTKFFTMLDPFAYLAATQGLNKQTLQYQVGERFRISYLLTVYNEPKPAGFLDGRFAAWDWKTK